MLDDRQMDVLKDLTEPKEDKEIRALKILRVQQALVFVFMIIVTYIMAFDTEQMLGHFELFFK